MDKVFQFSDIAWPAIAFEPVQGLWMKRLYGLPRLGAVDTYKMLR
jgi:hypothetical protein